MCEYLFFMNILYRENLQGELLYNSTINGKANKLPLTLVSSPKLDL